ncbi:hypothetical protein [Pseudactinotalea sp. Z1732]|uniref:hypothetical protein n=1 Tax=Micrococcales TaxID=85006 RepID=UPI003C797DA3
MTAVKAIQTRYAGCHFRSRLEARWAVFFDHLGITWEYEPQGVIVTDRITGMSVNEHPYLPDFWLPDLGLWAEVKGHLTPAEAQSLINAAASLSSNDGGGCHDAGGNDLLVLGPVPRPGRTRTTRPIRLHMHKGDLIATPWDCGQYDGDPHGSGPGPITYNTVACDSGDIHATGEQLLTGLQTRQNTHVEVAYTAARSARFEHGQNGPTP